MRSEKTTSVTDITNLSIPNGESPSLAEELFHAVWVGEITSGNWNHEHCHCHLMGSFVPFEPGSNHEFLGLYFNLREPFEYSIKDLPPGTIAKNQYNMVYLPQVQCRTVTQNGKCASLSVQFDLALLEGSLVQYPMLRKFLKKVRLKIPATVSRMHLAITPEMQLIIGDILHNTFTGVYRKIFLRSKAVDILICCLEHIASSGKLLRVALRPPDVAKMETVRDYLLQNLQYPCSPDLLADKVSMNKSRLIKYFRLYTGKTLYDFQRDERMKKAKALLRDSNLPISDIALAVGYRRLSNFSDAFKMTFGYSPKAARQSSHDLKKDKK